MPDDSLAILELSHPQFGPLQVRKDRDRAVEFLFQRTNARDCCGMVFVLAMAHVDTKRICARL